MFNEIIWKKNSDTFRNIIRKNNSLKKMLTKKFPIFIWKNIYFRNFLIKKMQKISEEKECKKNRKKNAIFFKEQSKNTWKFINIYLTVFERYSSDTVIYVQNTLSLFIELFAIPNCTVKFILLGHWQSMTINRASNRAP